MYKEKVDKLNLDVSNSDRDVKIKVTCENASMVSITYGGADWSNTVNCGDDEIIMKASSLKEKRMSFTCVADNLEGEKKIIHKIYEIGGESITYTFPDDFRGKPSYNKAPGQIKYKFYCNFK